MPNWNVVTSTTPQDGLYVWLCTLLERRHAQGDPRETYDGAAPRPPCEQLARARDGQPATVPAWALDGRSARAAGFVGAVPRDRAVRARAYTVRPDDTVTPVDS